VIEEEEHMLTLTETAQDVVKEIVSRSGEPDGAGLRIEARDPDATEFAVDVAPAPGEHDEVVEQSGARVFLGETAAQALDDKMLDARVSQDGRVAFDITNQET
jgi:iron-sulfur cluster assembly protein